MTADSVALHKAKHLLSHLLAAAGAKLWPGTALGESGETPTGFYADFGLPGSPGEAELETLTDEMARRLRETRHFREVRLSPADALQAFKGRPWQTYQVEVLAEAGSAIRCYEIDGFLDVCACALKDLRELRAVHPEKFLVTGACPVVWSHRGKDAWFIRISGELFPPPPPCACC